MADTSGNLGDRAASGAAWLTIQTILARAIGLMSQLVLAWLLVPAEFGQIALVYTITAFTTQLVNPGVDSVLLQKQKHIRRWVNPAFWLCLLCGLLASFCMLVASAIVVIGAQRAGNTSYGDIRLFYMVAILSAGAPFNAAALVPMVMLQNQMRFARISAINFGEALLQQILIITFAALGFGAYSFVIPMPIVSVIRFMVLWRISKPPVRSHLSSHRWPAMISSTGWMFGVRLLATATSQGDYIVLGWFMTKEVVGEYFFAFVLSTQIVRMLCDNISAALLPALTAIQDDRERMLLAAARAQKVLSAMITPLAMLQILLAGPVVRLLYNPKWEPAIPLVQWLSVGPLLFPAIWPAGILIQAEGRFREGFFAWLVNATVFFSLVVPLTWCFGAVGTAMGVTCWAWFAACFLPVIAYRTMGGLRVLFEAVSWPISAAVIAMAPSVLLLWIFPERSGFDILAIILVMPMVLVIYLSLMRRWDRETFDTVTDRALRAAGPILRRCGFGSWFQYREVVRESVRL